MSFNRNRVIFLSIVLLVVASSTLRGQDTARYIKGTNHLYLNTSVEMNSTGLTNEFVSDFYNSKFLTYKLRRKVSSRLSSESIAGYRLDGGLFYVFAPDDFNKKVGYYIGVEEHSLAEARFSRNFFDLVFFGNEDFTNKRINLDDLKLNIMAWQQFKVGIFKTFYRDNNVHQLGFGVALNKGQRHFCIDVHKASFFTQKNAEYVTLDMDMDVYHTDSSKADLAAFNGYGVSADFSYNYTDRRNHEVQLRISNIGYIRWDKSPDNFHREKSFRFDGFTGEVTPMGILWPKINSKTGDSIANEIYISDRQKPYSVMLPLDIDVIYTYTFEGRHASVTTEFKHRFFSLYRPFYLFKPGYKWFIKKSSFGIYPVFTIGGYGTYNAGLNLSTNIGKKFFMEIGTGTLNSIISPGSFAGLSGTVTLFKTF